MYKDIDEAIKCEKEKSEHAKEEYLMLQDDNWTDIETYEKRLDNCVNFIKYHEQLAEWLEELKFLRTAKETMYREIFGKGRYDAFEEAIAYFEIHAHEVHNHVSARDFICDRLEQLKESKNG